MPAGTFFLQEMDTSGAPPAFLCRAPSSAGLTSWSHATIFSGSLLLWLLKRLLTFEIQAGLVWFGGSLGIFLRRFWLLDLYLMLGLR